ncbi:MAG: hypothetical protein ACRDY7_10405 [Acidimicrobiia bacterium]
MSPFRVRLEQLAEDALVVIRGGDLDPVVLRRDAIAAFRRFGEYGVSVFAAADRDALDELARHRLVRFEALAIMTAGAIRAIDLEVRPTFRRPHYTVMLPDIDRDIHRLTVCEHVKWVNPHFRHPEERP